MFVPVSKNSNLNFNLLLIEVDWSIVLVSVIAKSELKKIAGSTFLSTLGKPVLLPSSCVILKSKPLPSMFGIRNELSPSKGIGVRFGPKTSLMFNVSPQPSSESSIPSLSSSKSQPSATPSVSLSAVSSNPGH